MCVFYLVEPEGPELLVSAPNPDGVDTLGSQLGHGGGPGHLELPLLPQRASLAAGCPAFMPMVSRDTHLT